MNDQTFWAWLGGLFVPAATAAVGAWIGARIALNKYREERSFDRRLEWLEKLHVAAKRAYDCVGEMYVYHAGGHVPPREVQLQYRKRFQAYSTLAVLIGFYGSGPLSDALEPLNNEIGDLTTSLAATIARTPVAPEVAQDIHRLGVLYMNIAKTVALHGRKHLDIKD